MLKLLARPTRFELVTLGLEMQGIEHTNDLVLHRFVNFTIVILQRVYKNGLKTHLLIFQNYVRNYYETGINFYLNSASSFGVLG